MKLSAKTNFTMKLKMTDRYGREEIEPGETKSRTKISKIEILYLSFNAKT